MKIIQVEYSRLVGTGNYENEKVGGLAFVDVDEPPEEALSKLKQWVSDQINVRMEEAQEVEKRSLWMSELSTIERRLIDGRQKYADLQTILAHHGIALVDLPDYDNIPF